MPSQPVQLYQGKKKNNKNGQEQSEINVLNII